MSKLINMSEPKIYIGKGKASKFGIKLSICLSDIPKEHVNEYQGKKYLNVEVTEMKQPDKFGKTHTVTVDTWKPEPKEPDNSLEPAGDDLPF